MTTSTEVEEEEKEEQARRREKAVLRGKAKKEEGVQQFPLEGDRSERKEAAEEEVLWG